MRHQINNVHIFNVGSWEAATGPFQATPTVLDQIVDAFSKLNASGRIPLKFGHNDEQAFTDGQPAIGWVTRVWREGQKLFADFADVPTIVFNAIKEGLYKFVSIELLHDVEVGGAVYPNALDAVALLGADKPAVTVLDDIQKLLMSRSALKFASKAVFSQAIPKARGKIDMDKEELEAAIKAALGPLQTRVDTVLTENNTLKTQLTATTTELEKLKKTSADQEAARTVELVKTNRERVIKLFEAAVKAKKLTPANRDKLLAKFKVNDDQEVVKLDFEILETLVDTKEETVKTPGNNFNRGRGGEQLQDSNDEGDENEAGEQVLQKVIELEDIDRAANRPLKDRFMYYIPEVLRRDSKLARRWHAEMFESSSFASDNAA